MSYKDIEAIGQLANFAKRDDHVMIDIAKYPFFGGDISHKKAESLSTFLSQDFDQRIKTKDPYLAAAWKMFNHAMNSNLVKFDKLFDKTCESKYEKHKAE